MEDIRKNFTVRRVIFLTIYILISAFIYRGFFYPDEIFIKANPLFKTLSTVILITFPLIVLFSIFIFIRLFQGRIKISSIVLSLLTFLFMILLVYPVGEYLYKKRYRMNLERYHTFLQLKPPIPESISKDKLNVFCLGGSTTEFRDKNGRDWPSITESLINSKFNSDKFKFYNLGKQWYTTQHTLINYIQNLRDLKPDYLIVMHNINDLLVNADFSRFSNGNFRYDYGHFLGPEALMIKYGSLAEFIFNNIRLLWYREKPIDINTDQFPGLISFKRNLITLIELAKSDSVRIMLMTQPNIYKDKMTDEELNSLTMLNKEAIGDGIRWTYKTAFEGIKKYNDAIRKLASEMNVSLIDLERAVPKNLEYFYDDVHYKDKTYDLIGEYLAETLYEKFIINEYQKPQQR